MFSQKFAIVNSLYLTTLSMFIASLSPFNIYYKMLADIR
jgi:hypothetical protein